MTFKMIVTQLMLHGYSRHSARWVSSAFLPTRARSCYCIHNMLRRKLLPHESLTALRTLTTTASSTPGKGLTQNREPIREWEPIDVPLVFVPGMKGTHLAFSGEESDATNSESAKKKRVWLTLSHLLNIPPRPDGDPLRDLSLPLTYDEPREPKFDEDDILNISSRYPMQHRGKLVPDGIVDHIIEFSLGNKTSSGDPRNNFVDLNFLPFYGHTTRLLREMDEQYHKRIRDGKVESTNSFQTQDDDNEAVNAMSNKGIFDRLGSFVERTSNWAFVNTTKSSAQEQQQLHDSTKHSRPTAVFSYDWRRSLPELCTDLHDFCETTFPGQPVQILAHSMGGLMAFAAMRSHPEKYDPGAVVVGVPFETGIQYLQDLHKGYYTELDRCRQFIPESQFTMSSHWSFFPISKKRLEDRFVDVSKQFSNDPPSDYQVQVKFDADVSGIGKPTSTLQPTVEGENAYFNFYDPNEWEMHQLGVFGPEYDDKIDDSQRKAYKQHMQIQMTAAKEWRAKVLGECESEDNGKKTDRDDTMANVSNFPPFVACASDKVPTVNQILRRKRQLPTTLNHTGGNKSVLNKWEYDYINGRSVPGDGRIDYDKAFPPSFIAHKKVTLDSAHAKQMCWEESGGSFARVYQEVVEQINEYVGCRPLDILEAQNNNLQSHLS
eukprot:scaffold80420_cov49-Cyclotella_meneghiniana.AAC.6